MSCQQASRFITTTQAATTQAATAATRRIATATTATPATATATAQTAGAAAANLATTTKTTPVTLDVDVEGVVIVAAGKTNTPEDPYVFTETIATTPPILFNAQVRADTDIPGHTGVAGYAG